MRRALRWTLGSVLVASAAALWWPRTRVALVPEVQRATEPTGGAIARRESDAPSPLPGALVPLVINPAHRDPFGLAGAPVATALMAPPVVAPTPPAAPMPAQQTPAPPEPPPLRWRYYGAMTTPDGQSILWLAEPERAPVRVVPGQPIGDGFVVVSRSASEVRLRHPAHSGELVISIPAPTAPER